MTNKYELLDKKLRQAGFATNGVEQMGDWDRTTVCSRQLHDGAGYSGNSFWVTLLSDGWYVGTWGGLLYRVPEPGHVAPLCIEWLTREAENVRTDFDADIKEKFALTPVSENEFDDAAGETWDKE